VVTGLAPLLKQYMLNPPILLPDDTATKARSIVRETRSRVLPVVSDEKTMHYMGLLRRRSLLLLSSTRSNLLVRDLMEEAKVELNPESGLAEAARLMLEADEPYAPVVGQGGRLVGVAGYEAVVKYLLDSDADVLYKPVDECMTSSGIVYVTQETPVYKAWQLMLSHNLPALPVVEDGEIIGVIAEYDLLAHGYARPELEAGARKGPRVRDAMSTPAVTLPPGSRILDAAEIIVDRGIGRVYIASGDRRLIGVVDRSDIVAAWLGFK